MFAFMFAFVLLGYMQRTSIAVAASSIMPALHLTLWQIGLLNATFTALYALTQVPGGVLGQRIGARRTFVLTGALGCVATVMVPLAPLLLSGALLFAALLAAQALMGAAQGPLFPVSAAVMEAWFSVKRWSMVVGLQTSGALLGGALTPLLVTTLTGAWGWQPTLLVIAVPAALLTLAWAKHGRDDPRSHAAVSRTDLDELKDNPVHRPAPLTWRRLGAIVADRNVLILTLSYLAMNYSFYFLSYWSFIYLVQVRHFSGIESGIVGMVPWIGAAVGCASGGIADRMVDRFGPRRGYRIVPLLTLPSVAVLMLLTNRVTGAYQAVAVLTLIFAAVEINEGAYWAATMRVAPSDVAAATGFLNLGGNLGGIACQLTVAALVSVGWWNAAFATGAVLAIVAAALWLLADAGHEAHPDARHKAHSPSGIAAIP